jgi:DNA-binding transcriptional LysR family regulator
VWIAIRGADADARTGGMQAGLNDLAAGRLVECLPEFASDSIDLYICYASRRHLPGRARVFIDFLV